jgi:hypothetical protein
MKKILFKILLILLTIPAIPQDLPVPALMLRAYRQKTRTAEGVPGKEYWQNHADYQINVEVLPDSNLLLGNESIVYHNESPDTLRQLVIRIYQDLFKSNNPRQFQVNMADLHSGVLIDSLVINGVVSDPKADPLIKKTPTNLIIQMKEPLLPAHKASLFFRWSLHIPAISTIRMGHYPAGGLFIAYYYPQVAVYDDVDGWDLNEYLGNTEFYNDFSDYELEVKVPAGYLVWATGTLANDSNIFKNEILNKLSIISESDTLMNIVAPDDRPAAVFKDSLTCNTWKYVACNVPDMAFAMAAHYNWDATSLVVDSASGRRTMVFALYPESAPNYKQVALIAKNSILFLSNRLPGVAYPYSHSITFCNGREDGGMEFPMMTNNGAPGSLTRLAELTFHEISHSYFPFYMGINERKYAWMDEGWATMLSADFISSYHDSTTDLFSGIVHNYLQAAGTEYDVPPIIPSCILNSPSYRYAAYSRPALAYSFLRDALGKEMFSFALKSYILNWNGRHPVPQDFFNIYNTEVGEDLDWFWKPWFYEIAGPDLLILQASLHGKKMKVLVKNSGGLPLPVDIHVQYAGQPEGSFYYPCSIWKKGDRVISLTFPVSGKPLAILLGNEHIPDIRPDDNIYMLP